jgi:hypothetical protein
MIVSIKILLFFLLTISCCYSQTNEKAEKVIEPDSIQFVKNPCPYQQKNNKICPFCKKDDTVIPIVYGLIAEIKPKNEDENTINTNGLRMTSQDSGKSKKKKYKSGGCVIRDCQPYWFCERDEKEF